MLLAIDVGNTEITLGLFSGDRLNGHWRLTTVAERTPDEWSAMVTSYLSYAGHSTHEVRAAIEASVAPGITELLARGIGLAVGLEPVQVTPSMVPSLPIELDVDDPLSVGADRLINALAAWEGFRRDCIVVDFGTATTFDCVTGDGRFIGGVIAPGIKTASEHLVRRAARLFATELIVPKHVIGRRTEDCMRSGILYSTADAVDGIVRRIKAEWPGEQEPQVVATGGLAKQVMEHTQEIEVIEPNLTLVGLRRAAEHLGLEW